MAFVISIQSTDIRDPRTVGDKQCKVLSLSRSSVYYARKGESAYNFALMTLIDKQFLETPFMVYSK